MNNLDFNCPAGQGIKRPTKILIKAGDSVSYNTNPDAGDT